MTQDGEFAELAAARWRFLVRSAVLLGANVPEAEDLAQTALLHAYLKWDRVRLASDRNAYLATILVNTFRESRRRRWWRERPTERLPERAGVDSAIEAVDDADAVRRALTRLPLGQREVLVLRYYAHLGEAQIADALGIAPGTVKSRLSRALGSLADDPHLNDLTGRTP